MQRLTLTLSVALLAAAPVIATAIMPTSSVVAQEKKGGKPRAAVPPTAPDKAAKEGKAGPGTCGSGMYYDKEKKQCADATDKKK